MNFRGTLLEKGRKEGAQQKAIEAAVNLLKMKLGTVEQIEKAEGLPRNYCNNFDCSIPVD